MIHLTDPITVFVDFDEFGEYEDNFDDEYFDRWANEFTKDNDIRVRKGGGAGYFCRVEDHINIGGNDPIFQPMYWEDKDLFMRMQMEGYKFIMTSKSLIWHFTSRTSRFPNGERELDNNKRPATFSSMGTKSYAKIYRKVGTTTKKMKIVLSYHRRNR